MEYKKYEAQLRLGIFAIALACRFRLSSTPHRILPAATDL
jgi:hypothetical protein